MQSLQLTLQSAPKPPLPLQRLFGFPASVNISFSPPTPSQFFSSQDCVTSSTFCTRLVRHMGPLLCSGGGGGGSYVVLGMLVLLLVFARQHNNFNFQTRDMVQNRFVVQWYYALRFHGTNCSSMASICCGSNGRAVVQWYCATAKMSQWVS